MDYKTGPLDSVDYNGFETVEKIFDSVQGSLDRGERVEVSYNREFGYPEKVFVHPRAAGVDPWFSIEAQNFEVMKRQNPSF